MVDYDVKIVANECGTGLKYNWYIVDYDAKVVTLSKDAFMIHNKYIQHTSAPNALSRTLLTMATTDIIGCIAQPLNLAPGLSQLS